MTVTSALVSNTIGVVLAVVTLFTFNARRNRSLEDKLLLLCLLIPTICCAVEVLSFAVDGKNGLFFLIVSRLVNTALYVGTLSVGVAVVLFVRCHLYGEIANWVKERWYLFLPPVLLVLLLLVNLVFPLVFQIDGSNVYHRALLSPLYFLCTIYYCITSMVMVHRFSRNSGVVQFFPIHIFFIPVLLGFAIQFFFFGVSIAWPMVIIGIVGIFMSLQNSLAYVDSLTKLNNRAYFDHLISETINKAHRKVGIIMGDIDHFKRINDDFGHSEGDRALIDYASILRRTITDRGIAVRYAGDEFIIIQNTDDEWQISQTVKKLYALCDKYNETGDKPYELTASAGCGIYDPDSETFDEFIKRIDKLMFEQKANFYATHKQYDRRK